ncbi:PAS domain S-box protein [Halobacillus hunanensis]|uniref:PAS domain S-box protein n=1 Tax=Halobacillus hunanensis TaxID=578214 RepID=UPI001592165F|nr:PAS domain S-box protein [Halobacillus hunanensis]
MENTKGSPEEISLQVAFQSTEREVLRVLMEGMSDFVFLMEVENYDSFRYLYINHTSEQCYQLNRSIWKGKQIEEMLDQESAAYIKRYYQKVVETAEPLSYRDTIDIHGKEFYGETLLTPFKNAKGDVVQVLAITRDITELAKKEHELDTVSAVYHSLLENTADAILIVDVNGVILEANPAFEKMYGFSKEELQQTRFPFVPPSLKKEADELIEKAVRREHISGYETKRRHKNGNWVDVSVTVSPIYGARGHVIGVSSIIRNISEQKVMNQNLKASRTKYESLFKFNPYPVVTLTLKGIITKINPAVLHLLNTTEGELLHSPLTKWVHEEEASAVNENIKDSFSKEKTRFQTRLVFNHQEKIVNVFLAPILTGQGKAGMYAILEDITDKEQAVSALKQSEAKFKLIADHSQDLIFVFNPYGTILYGSPSNLGFFGFDPIRTNREKVSKFVHPHEMELLEYRFRTCNQFAQSFTLKLRFLRKDQEWVWFEVRGTPVLDEQNRVTHVVVVCRDISGQISYEERLKSYAFYDFLTDLPNRRMFEDLLDSVLLRNEPFALLYLDGDGFKHINDSYGHDIGDDFLKMIGKRLDYLRSEDDMIARIGGDEFAILFTGVANVEEARKKTGWLLNELRKPYQVGEQRVYSSFSIGVSCYPVDAGTKSELFRRAD